MKGVCDYIIIRNGKELSHGGKHNVVFDIPKYIAEDYMKIRHACISAATPAYNQSSAYGQACGLFQRTENYYLNLFKGIRLYSESISLTDPRDIRVPVLMAGPTKNASAPATQAQSSTITDSSKIITTATWSISGSKTLRSIALCNRFSAENMHNGLDASTGCADSSFDGYLESSASYGSFSIGRIISNAKAITRWLVGSSPYGAIRGCNLTPDMSKMTLKPTPAFYRTIAYETNYGACCGFFVNPAKTKAYIIDSSGQSGSYAIYVYNISDWTLDKTYLITYGTSNAILFTDDADYLYSCVFGSATVSVYTLSRSDSSITLIGTVTKNVASSSGYAGLMAMNNRLVAYVDGDVIGLPILDGETYTFPKYYSYRNSYISAKMCIQLDGDNVVVPMTSHETSSILSNSQTNIEYFTQITIPAWLNTTALNFDTPIELEDGDTFVVSYKVGLGNLVTFNSNGGSSVESQIVVTSGTATEPTAPTKDGYTFGGWYSDEALTSAFNFSTAITADITLFAKWN